MIQREPNLIGAKRLGKVNPRDLGIHQAGTFQISLSKVDATQIAIAKVGIGEVEPARIHSPQIAAPIVAAREFTGVQ